MSKPRARIMWSWGNHSFYYFKLEHAKEDTGPGYEPIPYIVEPKPGYTKFLFGNGRYLFASRLRVLERPCA